MSLAANSGASEPPPLPFRNRSFLSFLGTQALGAFNDNVFKQVVLLLCVGYVVIGIEFQTIVQFLFALPFLVFSGLAGDLADRYSKGRLMVLCKVAEVVVMLCGLAVFLQAGSGQTGGVPNYVWLLALVTFLMGTQSSFFGPPKYGGLPELVRRDDLAPAAGLTQMTTFLAIILGVSLAGLLLDEFADRLYVPGIIAVLIAIFGTAVSLGIKQRSASDPGRRIGIKSFFSVIPTLAHAARNDRLLFVIMVVYAWFWFVGGVALTGLNAFGRLQLGLSNFETSLLVSTLSVGIAAGSATVGRMSRGKVRLGLIVPGLIGIIVLLGAIVLVPAHAPTADDLKAFLELKTSGEALEQSRVIPEATAAAQAGAFAICFLLGVAAGFFSVPMIAFIQARPPAAEKGQVFAAANWLNWIFIIASSVYYGAGMSATGHQANVLLGSLGALTLVVAVALLPWLFRRLKKERPDFVYFPPK